MDERNETIEVYRYGEKNIGSVTKGFAGNLWELDENFDIFSVFLDGKKVK